MMNEFKKVSLAPGNYVWYKKGCKIYQREVKEIDLDSNYIRFGNGCGGRYMNTGDGVSFIYRGTKHWTNRESLMTFIEERIDFYEDKIHRLNTKVSNAITQQLNNKFAIQMLKNWYLHQI